MMRSFLSAAAVIAPVQASGYNVEQYGSEELAIAAVEARHDSHRGLQVRQCFLVPEARVTPRPTAAALVDPLEEQSLTQPS